MRNKIVNYIKSIPWHIWILMLIMVAGVFFRTYHFRDWLEFSPDEARDATVVSNVLDGKEQLPSLGPIAGGTNFHLGPIFYYFEYSAASIFGNSPDKMAYADLLFSVLAMPFLFLFLKKYFKTEISLALSALMSVSYFFIYISRFASNPNSIPFFTLLFLYSLLELMEEKNKHRYVWPILIGISAGVLVQLHTLLLLIVPSILFLFFLYSVFKKEFFWKNFLLIAAFFTLFNIPQITNEIKTNGSNLQAFFQSSSVQSRGGTKILKNIGTVVSCQIQANAEMISSAENIAGCGDIFYAEKTIKKYKDTPGVISNASLFKLAMILSVIFSIVGYFFLGYYYRKEKNESKKNFLRLFIVYNIISILFFMPVAPHMELRYYVILFFTPFVLLGLWLKFFVEKISKAGKIIFAVIIALAIILNVVVVWKASYVYRQNQASDAEKSVLGEVEPIIGYITDNSQSKTAYMAGSKVYFKRFFPALVYLADKSGIKLIEFKETTDVGPKSKIFFIAPTPSNSKKQQELENAWERSIKDKKQFGKITIYILE